MDIFYNNWHIVLWHRMPHPVWSKPWAKNNPTQQVDKGTTNLLLIDKTCAKLILTLVISSIYAYWTKFVEKSLAKSTGASEKSEISIVGKNIFSKCFITSVRLKRIGEWGKQRQITTLKKLKRGKVADIEIDIHTYLFHRFSKSV